MNEQATGARESRHETPAATTAVHPAWVAERCARVRTEIGRVIVGLEEVTELALVAVLAGGHCLLEGVPGLAKTLLVRCLRRALGLRAARIQFTPDLMPSDITGAEVIVEDRERTERRFRFIRGPVFTHLLLADEINRTPPKTQAALMEAMEEGQVTSMGRRYPLEPPFHVFATQNPIEQEATYPLPAAQLDRFMFKVLVDYPSEEEEYRIVRQTTALDPAPVAPVLSREEVLTLQAAVRAAAVPPPLHALMVRLVRATRPDRPEAPAFVRAWLAWGAGPRAEQFLSLAVRARALLHGRSAPTLADLTHLVKPVLRHRLLLSYEAESEGLTSDHICEELLAAMPEFRAEPAARRRRLRWWRRRA